MRFRFALVPIAFLLVLAVTTYNPFNNNCAPVSATFDIDSIFHATNNVNTYYWIVDDGAGLVDTTAIAGNIDSFLYNNFVNVGTNIKIYTVTLTAALNTGGCVVPFSQPIIVHPVPVSDFTATPIENCDFVQFAIETTQKAGILIYDWDFSAVPSNNPLLDDSFDLTFQRPEPNEPDLLVDVSLVLINTSWPRLPQRGARGASEGRRGLRSIWLVAKAVYSSALENFRKNSPIYKGGYKSR